MNLKTLLIIFLLTFICFAEESTYKKHEVLGGGVIGVGYSELGFSYRKYFYKDLSALDIGYSMLAATGRSRDHLIYVNHKIEAKTFLLSAGVAASRTKLVYGGNDSYYGRTLGMNAYVGNRWKTGDNVFIEVDWVGIYKHLLILSHDNMSDELMDEFKEMAILRLLSFKLGWRF